MTHRSESQTRNPPRTRRLSSCYLHPADPATGICASCLRERLYGLDSSVDDPGPSSSSSSFIPLLNNGGFAGATSPALRRCRSVFAAKCEAFTSSHEPRRKSCDVGARNGKSLAHLFDVDDEERSGSNGGFKVESRNILRGGGAVELAVEDLNKNGGEIRDFRGGLQGNGNSQEDDNVDEGEVKTMKEHIDLELQSKTQKLKDFKEVAGNIREAASVFSKKLQKWRQKQKKKLRHGGNAGGIGGGSSELDGPKGQNLGETQSEVADFYGVLGRRSCDTDPRFSVDAGRLSVDGGRISFDEPRASWDGYLIARTIPRLAPMLSVVDDAMLSGGNRIEHHHHRHRVSVDGQMQSIMEDESSSGSGGSAQSNSDSWSSQRRSSFDRSSSVRSFGKKMVGMEGDYARGSPAKLVITERELKDWHLNSIKDNHMNKSESASMEDSTTAENRSNLGPKKAIRWRKVWNVFGFKQKYCDTKSERSCGDSMDCSPALGCEKQEKEVDKEVKDTTGWKLMRSDSIVGARRSCEVIRLSSSQMRLADDAACANRSMEKYVLGRNRSANYASSNLDDGVLPFYWTPLRSSSNRRSGRNKLQNSHFVHGNILHLN